MPYQYSGAPTLNDVIQNAIKSGESANDNTSKLAQLILGKQQTNPLEDAYKTAQIVDLLGTEGANKILPKQSSTLNPLGQEIPQPDQIPQQPQAQTQPQPQQPQTLEGYLSGPTLGKRQREVMNKATELEFQKQPTGRGLTYDPATGLNKITDRPLTEDERQKRESQDLELQIKKKDLARKDKEATEVKPNQSQAALFGKRMQQAEQEFQNLENSGFDRTSAKQGVMSYSPINALKSPGLQQQEQAEKNFVNAVLRRESGASISAGEFTSAEQQYFPRAGDSPQVLQQKKMNRQLAIQGLKVEAGDTAWKKLDAPNNSAQSEEQEYLQLRKKHKGF